MGRDVKAVLFDLDGTLVDSLPELYEGVRRAMIDLGHQPPSKEQVRDMIGRGVQVLVQRILDSQSLPTDAESREALLQLLIKHWGDTAGEYTEFFPGTIEGIKALRAAGIKVGLVTNKWHDLAVEFLEHQGILSLFDVIVAGDDCPRNKPAPDMLEKAMRDLGVTKEESIMVGDSRNDALAARAAGVREALVETGYNEGVSIQEWAREEGFTRCYQDARSVCDAVVQGTFS